MIITLITESQLFSTPLPAKVSGRYWICDKDSGASSRKVAYVEGQQDNWVLHGTASLQLFDNQGAELPSVQLDNTVQIINGRYSIGGNRVQVLVEPATDDRQMYGKYCVHSACKLSIGRAADNQIIYASNYTTSHHANLIWDKTRWTIEDDDSRNGTFVNGVRTKHARLNPGDLIYIMGLKIIVGDGFFAVNNPDGLLSISTPAVSELHDTSDTDSARDYYAASSPETFCRAPRIKRNIAKREIKVDAPPQRQRKEETPIALLLGPALTMGMTAVVMGAIAVLNLSSGKTDLTSALPTIIMSFSMLCGTILWPFLAKGNDKKKNARAELHRQAKYREYLDDIRSQIFSLGKEQREILLENYPNASECYQRVKKFEEGLWERTAECEEFLQLRLGLGSIPLLADFRFPEKRFSVDEDVLVNEVMRLSDEPKLVNDAPVLCSLLRNPVIGIIGSEKETTSFLKDVLLQILALHSPEDVKLAFAAKEANEGEWKALRLLPHLWGDGNSFRFFAAGDEDAKAVCAELEKILLERKETAAKVKGTVLPHYVVILESSSQAEKAGLFKYLSPDTGSVSLSCITVGRQLTDLPKECSLVIELKGKMAFLYNRNDMSGEKVMFALEESLAVDINEISNRLANISLQENKADFILPDMLTFLEMYGVGKVDHLNALTRWKENSPVNTLQAPVGISSDGSLSYLDLHEKSHGPHGLVAGMTGSGKSEFIITYILSMAVNYHPDEVAFILIDYKGGGLAGAFEDNISGVKLPHLAGTITNLDGSAVNRALISIQSELRRRQAIFNAAKQISGEGTIDIYKYQKMYRSGLVSEPVPHLFIISDEFAELKAQQPDFMAQLISAARIGRSLGVHLILATQKPSGVVDDQIWSNSRFRVCLKVQERADSVEMLKRPEAAELKETGRFYLQVGFDELFSLGQSAWCGAPYYPSDEVEQKHDDGIEVIDHLGRTVFEAKPKSENRISETSQVVSIVRYLSQLTQEDDIGARRLWLPPIPEMVFLPALEKKYQWSADPVNLEPIIGEYDDPFNQAQGLLTIPLTKEGNVLIYGTTGSGKNTLLNTVLVGLLKNYSSEQLNVYIMDLGEETLRIFANAPQVGDVLLSSDAEKINNLFKMLQEEIERRKKLFATGEGNYVSDHCIASEPLPQILVILRNYSVFAEQFEALDEKLIQITRDCNKYGIYFILTANTSNAVRYRVTQNFANTYVLQLNDVSDYIGLFGSTGGVYPSKYKGRGIFKTDKVYEFQTAHFEEDYSQNNLKGFIGALQQICESSAKPVPVLPEKVTAASFAEAFRGETIPVGIEKLSLRPCAYNFDRSTITPILTQNPEELSRMVQGLTEQFLKITDDVTVIDGTGLLQEYTHAYAYSSESEIPDTVKQLFDELVRRNNSFKRNDSSAADGFSRKYCVVIGLPGILNGLDSDGQDKLNVLLEKNELPYNVRFILCGTVKEINPYSARAWYKRHITGFDGIWVGDGIGDQYLLKIGKITGALYSDLPEGFGYVVKKGKPVLAKLISGEQSEVLE